MRPVRRGANPLGNDFADYRDAKPFLVSRIGSGWFLGIHVASYCSYCERPLSTNLAIEHIQPKGLKVGLIEPYAHLKGRWENFLLACVNCNSTKGDDDVVLAEVLLPDRDNTFLAFEYPQDGTVRVAITGVLADAAEKTLSMTGLDKAAAQAHDENMRAIALERVSERMNTWLLAQSSKDDVDNEPLSEGVRRGVVKTALSQGFFSVWMKVFEADQDIRNRLIDAFSGTRDSGCFTAGTTVPCCPAPNPDALAHGSKT
jgi:5-methylcytosine-specific restriction endonuclease McrA